MSKKPIQKAVDLFCGRGTFTFALSRFCEVDGFESEATALAALEKAALQFNRQVKVIQRDLFNSPLSVDELNQYRFAVINPPRSGALSQCKNIASTKLDSLVYISCSPESFAEDAAILCSEGYSLQEVTPLDQFYWSHHLEVVGYFTRI
jgi:23S rRNA (uracil1939-C5)-methyltransferase